MLAEIERDAEVWTPFGDVTALPPPMSRKAANDNHPQSARRPAMIGLTGLRNVGKSTVAEFLEEHFGFMRVHAFEAGKQAAETWFDYIGGDGRRMVYGDLKDVPSSFLPGNVSPRYFLERFGRFMGIDMGVNWTLGMEIDRIRRNFPRAPIVVESLVYEAPWFKAQGGIVWRLERPGHEGPAGIESDAAQADIVADVTISATSVDDLLAQANRAVQQVVGGE